MELNYSKLNIFFLGLLFCSAISFAQNKSSFWTKTTPQNASKTQQSIEINNFSKGLFYTLNINELKQSLELAPNIKTFSGESTIIIDFPMADNNFESFRVMESSVMEQSLQERYPELRSYVGQSILNPSTTIRFSVTPDGLYSMAMGTKLGTQFIEPYEDGNGYRLYSKKDMSAPREPWECGFIDEIDKGLEADIDLESAKNANDGMMREYRLALACTVEYAQFHGGTLPLVTAAMMTTMTRVNGIYERELSMRMMMVDNTSIIFLGPDVNSDPYTNDNGSAMLTENQNTVTANIGSANYDIGHVFSTGGGGIATLNSPCGNGKARGVTGLPNPVGDVFDIEFVCHEIGHQFGAPHTFNGNAMGTGCETQRSGSDAYEPGSGTTIMSYAGICSPQNVQGNADDYFHQKSLERIWGFISTGGGNCSTETGTGNTVPTVVIPVANYTIPKSTPYKLTGSSTDPDGTDGHTYTWEQYDLGPAGIPIETNTTGPMVRSYRGTSNPTRYIPRLEDILANGGVSTAWEVLPAVQRNQNFRLTVRDNDMRGGQNAIGVMTTNVNGTAGPFLVTSQETNQIVWTPGETEMITWDVAGTTGNGVNTANVNILLSTSQNPDANFDTVLASNVPNNGSFEITVPNVSAPYCRIMIEGAGNIFFNVNDNFFAIGNYSYVPGAICEDYLFNANLLLAENDMTFSGFNLNIGDSRTISDMNVSVDVTTTNNAELAMAIRAPGATDLTFFQSGSNNGCAGLPDALVTFDDEGIPNACTSTNTNLAIQPINPLSLYDGEDSAGDWAFFIGDIIVDGNRATWNTTTITICETGGFVPVLSVDEFGLDDTFSVFPNPNNGEFTVKFNSATTNNIAIEVYDIRGRSVLNKSFSNTGRSFNQTINLGNVDSGMYLLNVTDGDKKVTKKIIVN